MIRHRAFYFRQTSSFRRIFVLFRFLRFCRLYLFEQSYALAHGCDTAARALAGAFHTPDTFIVVYRGEVVIELDRAFRTNPFAFSARNAPDFAHAHYFFALGGIRASHIHARRTNGIYQHRFWTRPYLCRSQYCRTRTHARMYTIPYSRIRTPCCRPL